MNLYRDEYDRFITQVLLYCHENSGGTFDVASRAAVEFDRGYFVSREGAEETYDLLTWDAVNSFIERNNLATVGKLGIWKTPEGKWTLDVSYWIGCYEQAIAFGKSNHQRAIWDCSSGREIFL